MMQKAIRDRAELLYPGYVSIDRRAGRACRRWEDHAQPPPMPTALNAWTPGAVMRPRRGPRRHPAEQLRLAI